MLCDRHMILLLKNHLQRSIEDKLSKLKVEKHSIEVEIDRVKPDLEKVLFGP